MAPAKDLDAAVANIQQLKARVEAMGPVEQNQQMHQQAVANAMAPHQRRS
ncbi:hypothetical protein HU200_048844 [Digitaria exilis]|uniref:Uncharacterized protein n=1 Tax=Digitaria exilis TaxID=1010633 RepID=A0A835B5J1_9POAL|nr:hypothetical protein HU200_048844 [Digitaria exilis]